MKLIDFYDKRLPKGCRILPSCINCMVYCKWHKVKLLEYNTNTSAGHPKKIITDNQFVIIGIALSILQIGILLFYILG